MEYILKIAAVGLPTAVFALVLKKDSPAMSLVICAAAALVLTFTAANALRDVIDAASELADMSGMNGAVLAAILKTVGIAVVTRFTADTMKDAGTSSAASAAELAGAAAGLLAALPVIRTMIGMIRGLM